MPLYVPSVVLLCLFAQITLIYTSFYDNPELELPPESGTPLEELREKWEFEWGFSGIATFAHLPYIKCLTTPYEPFDIAILGAPFDTAVTYRPGARFGPHAIRTSSRRQSSFRGYNARAHLNPYTTALRLLDCGDIPITPFDNALALHQMTSAYTELLSRAPLHRTLTHPHPILVSLGGDHAIALAALRALHAIYGMPLAVVHFDAHLDTWHPSKYPSPWTQSPSQSDFTHGSMFWLARNEGLILNGSSVHAGLRTRLSGDDEADYLDDDNQGWKRIYSDDVATLTPEGVASQILAQIPKDYPVYLSIDIDVLDPAFAPGTGTPEPGGWSTRELIQVLRGVEGLNVVGADVVEVSPAYDGRGEQTGLAAAQVVFEVLCSLVKREVKLSKEREREERTGWGRDEL